MTQRLTLEQIDDILVKSFEDVRLSRSERQALSQVFADIADDEDRLRYVRNRAFDMARDAVRTISAGPVLDWLEEVVRVVDNQRQRVERTEARAYFSPGDDCMAQVTRLCRAARSHIDVCVFTITDNRIKRALIDAHRRRVSVRVITDDQKADDLGTDIY